jgi:hypothetical protein
MVDSQIVGQDVVGSLGQGPPERDYLAERGGTPSPMEAISLLTSCRSSGLVRFAVSSAHALVDAECLRLRVLIAATDPDVQWKRIEDKDTIDTIFA